MGDEVAGTPSAGGPDEEKPMTDELAERIRNLAAVYHSGDWPGVEAFLRANPELLPFVEQSESHIAKLFPESDLSLAVELDEDEEQAAGNAAAREPAEKLFLLISLPEGFPEAQAKLEQLDETWSIDVCEATGDRLVIDLVY